VRGFDSSIELHMVIELETVLMETLGAGLVYVLLKHFVDRYNIFFAYAPSRINKNIHTSAIYFVLAAFWVLQLTLLFFSLLRYGLYGVTIFALVGCVLTFLLVVFQAWFRRFRSLAPISYRKIGESRNGSSSQVRHIESFTTVNNQLNTEVTFLPEVLTESQCIGPTHLMETIATAIGEETIANSNGEAVTAEQPIPSRERSTPHPDVVYSYQKYNEDERI